MDGAHDLGSIVPFGPRQDFVFSFRFVVVLLIEFSFISFLILYNGV